MYVLNHANLDDRIIITCECVRMCVCECMCVCRLVVWLVGLTKKTCVYLSRLIQYPYLYTLPSPVLSCPALQ